MSANLGYPSPMQPLSIGNVVSAAVRLYRSHFKQYLGLAFQAILWAIIPIYGWAKLCTIHAMISRLAFSELVNQPEGLSTIRSQFKGRLWIFFVAQILVFLILFAANIGITILQFIINSMFMIALGREAVLIALLSLVVNLAGLVAYIWVYSRIFIPELPIAVEDNIDGSQAISRSWELTKGNVWRLQAIIMVGLLITLPLIFIAGSPFLFAFISLVVTASINPDAASSSQFLNSLLIYMLIGIILFLLANVIITPFWQAIKAVVYYDLRSRKEGLGLQLRDREI